MIIGVKLYAILIYERLVTWCLCGPDLRLFIFATKALRHQETRFAVRCDLLLK
jgi:hypothetical protein